MVVSNTSMVSEREALAVVGVPPTNNVLPPELAKVSPSLLEAVT